MALLPVVEIDRAIITEFVIGQILRANVGGSQRPRSHYWPRHNQILPFSLLEMRGASEVKKFVTILRIYISNCVIILHAMR